MQNPRPRRVNDLYLSPSCAPCAVSRGWLPSSAPGAFRHDDDTLLARSLELGCRSEPDVGNPSMQEIEGGRRVTVRRSSRVL